MQWHLILLLSLFECVRYEVLLWDLNVSLAEAFINWAFVWLGSKIK
jgi:hypothetical protein